MKLTIDLHDKDFLLELERISKKTKEGENLLRVSELLSNKHIIIQFAIALIAFIFLIFFLGREEIFWIYFSLAVFVFFLVRFFYLLRCYQKNKWYFLYFDDNIILKKDLDNIEYYPLKELSNVEILKSNDDAFEILRLSFGKKTMNYSYMKKHHTILEAFTKSLLVNVKEGWSDKD